jgi:ABC-type branched-subunit amino acid transport system substrate-binding protein
VIPAAFHIISMNRSPARLAAVACLGLGLALAGCGGGKVAAPARPGQAVALPPPPVVRAAPARSPEAAGKGVRVGILLPLSGNEAALGRAILDAAELALFDFGDDAFTLLPRDTGDTPASAAAAAESALADGARLLIGPLFAAATPAVAERARAAKVNVISLSNDRTIAGGGAFVFGFMPSAQVERVVGFARSRGLSRYAALIPDNAYGNLIDDALRRAASRAEGAVSAVERYDPASTDATPVVRRLAAYDARRAALGAQRRALEGHNDEVSREALKRLENLQTTGELPFDAVLLAEFGSRLLAMAPLLPFYDIEPSRVRFLGTAFWDDPRVLREAALLGGWFAAPPPAARAEFVRRFRETYGSVPPRVATLGYDAVALAAVLARAPGGADFSAAALTNPGGFSGADGLFRLLPNGTNQRGLAVLEVTRDGFKLISPAPESFEEATE